MMLSICLQGFMSSYPDGVSLVKDDNIYAKDNVIDSDYCSDKQDFIDFAKRNANYINEDTDIAIVVNISDVDTTAVLDYSKEIVKAIKEEAIGKENEL